MNLGLKRGTVELQPHQKAWEENANQTISMLKCILGAAAVDIQHIGSTSIKGICAKPIIDLVIGVRSFEDIMILKDALEAEGVIYRGQDHPGQHLFVMGDFEADTRTHHIHVVIFESKEWVNYVNFRDYLNTYPEKADEYDLLKRTLLEQFTLDRGKYTSGKQVLIDRLLKEAKDWRDVRENI